MCPVQTGVIGAGLVCRAAKQLWQKISRRTYQAGVDDWANSGVRRGFRQSDQRLIIVPRAMHCDGPICYAVVAYLKGELAEWVERLRREVHPEHAHLPAHITILPPRPLSGSESESVEWLVERCCRVAPFEVVMGDVESFVPTTPTVFIRVAHAAYKIRELHDQLSGGPLEYVEELPFMPHLTIAKMETTERACRVYEIARDRWDHYEGSHRATIENLSFVRGRDAKWLDLAPISLRAKVVTK